MNKQSISKVKNRRRGMDKPVRKSGEGLQQGAAGV